MSASTGENRIKVRVQRFTPSVDEKPHYQTYEIPFIDGLSVMNVLDYIYEKIDGTLAYYSHSACRRGVCTRCILFINGKAGLACQTLANGDITLETPPKLKVIRDLVYSSQV